MLAAWLLDQEALYFRVLLAGDVFDALRYRVLLIEDVFEYCWDDVGGRMALLTRRRVHLPILILPMRILDITILFLLFTHVPTPPGIIFALLHLDFLEMMWSTTRFLS